MRPAPGLLLPLAALLLLGGALVLPTDGLAPPPAPAPGTLPPATASPLPSADRTPELMEPRATAPVRTARAATRPVPRVDPIDTGGPAVTWSVDVEPATGLDRGAVAAEVTAALYDPRSWAATHQLERVEPGEARVAVLVATAATVDARCARIGLDTAGIFSCWDGTTALLTLPRWNGGDQEFPDLSTYRAYLVNHEVGHGLGFGHVDCPGPGRTAPVMQQQTRTTGGCVANAWPHP